VSPPRFVLASASPARLALLRAAGIAAEPVVSGVDESTVESADAAELTATLARLKAEAVATTATAGAARTATGVGDALVLGCDSMLAFDGEILGKPADSAEAVERWRRMRGRSGILHTGHHLIHASTGRDAAAGTATTVHFADVTDAEIEAYVATGEPLRVAGAFTIDGLGAPFVTRIEGDHGTVVGLSLPVLRHLLARLGIPITALWGV
jgi:septum formation protein